MVIIDNKCTGETMEALISIKHVLNTYNLVEDLVEEEQTRG